MCLTHNFMFVITPIEVVHLKILVAWEKISQGKYRVKMMNLTCIERG